MAWKRARSPEQKAARRRAILASTAELLGTNRVDDLSLNEIARHCDLAKSNIYRYFSSREDILLALLCDDLRDWLAAADVALATLPACPSPEALCNVLVGSIAERPRLIRLLGQLPTVIERNVSEETLLSFKIELRDLALAHATSLDAAVPWLDPMSAFHLTLFETTLVQGLWPIHSPPPVVRRVMENPELCMFQVPFEQALAGFLLPSLKGYQQGN